MAQEQVCKLDPKFKKKWLKALRSGKYQQTQGALRDLADNGEYGFCCLGVALDLKLKDTKTGWSGYRGHNSFLLTKTSTVSCDTTKWKQSNFAKEIGLTAEAQDNLAGLNDEGGGFEQIADYIEDHY